MTTAHKESIITCVSVQQAQDVIDYLFSKQLISRAEIIPTKIENDVKIIFENLEENLQQIEQEVLSLLGTSNDLQEI
jgi:5-bromo-4-chloroindolyl phosphate hydrolysis protein